MIDILLEWNEDRREEWEIEKSLARLASKWQQEQPMKRKFMERKFMERKAGGKTWLVLILNMSNLTMRITWKQRIHN